MKFIVRMLFCLLSIGFFLSASAENTGSLTLKDKPIPLKLVMGEDTFPFQFIDQNNKPAGILVELWQEWSLVTQTPIEIQAYNWKQSLQHLQEGKADIHIGMTANALRQERFDFASPVTSLQTYLFIHKSINKKLQLVDLLPYQIGIVAGSSHEQTLLDINPHFTFRKFPSREALLDGAANGDVLVFAGIEGYQRNLALEQDVANEYYSSSRLPIKKAELSPAVKKGNLTLVNKIDAGFKQINSEQIKKIERRWLGYNRQNAGVMIAMQTDVQPYVDIGIDGLPHGLFVDLWKLWSEKTGISIDFVIGDMNSSIEYIKRGFADVHIGYPESNQMRTGLQQAWHLTAVKSRFFSLQNNIKNLESLDNLRIGVFPTAPYLPEIHKLYPNAQLRFYESTSAMVNATVKGDILGFIASSAMTSHHLLTNKLWTNFKQYSDIEFTTNIYSLTRPDDNGLTERIKAGFDLISPEERLQIERKWLINPDDRYFSNQTDQIHLTHHEKTYLAKLGAIKMGYLSDWPPMEFQGKNGEFLGVNSDIKNLLVNHLGLSIIPVAFDTFEEMMQQLESGEIQLVASLAKNAEREVNINLSDVYWQSPWAIASNLSQPAILNISQLANKKIAVIEGYQLLSQLRQQFPGLTLTLVENTQEGLAAVANGRADMFIEKVASLADNLKDGQYPSLKLSLIADLAEQHSRIGVFNDLAELLPLINRVLQTIDKVKQQQLYQKWIDVEVSSDSQFYQRWMNWLILGLVLVCMVTITVFLANRRLNIEIKRRENAEGQLLFLANHDNVTGLPNRTLLDKHLVASIEQHQDTKSKFALLFIDLDGFKVINDEHGHHIGDELLAKVSQLFKQSIRTSDTIARFGGDEFVILLSNIDNIETPKRIADTMLQKLTTVNLIEDKSVKISASIGIAVYPQDGVTPHDLIKQADQLMYKAKRIGGHQHKFSQ